MFQIGKDVVCINDNWNRSSCSIITEYPVENRIYRVRDIVEAMKASDPNDVGIALVLEEIEPVFCICRGCLRAWDARHFRPVKDTSIDIFTKAPAPLEPVDA